ncbi:DMT family transporter [Microbacterium sp. SORGH_AS_0888]|uniref:DMT family transporter n=1 Tax=Microbacterium sp. SORGH_AS_0888 TaxID=3041791 RepID=UPI00277F5718|nr:DMT family transporter [Microbacterium sp. SORGH_AS_0888]MDQ1131144.1 drug/metabolite transporter (DMT)-like permease [Microbacterium sp. SORGH_AS_0888]
MASPSSPSSVSIAVQFTLTGVVWGSSFLFIAIALTGMTPAQVAGGRLLFGAIALGAIVAIRRERLPRSRRVWAHLCVLALTFCVTPFLLFAWAEQHVSSGLASIFNATTPIMTAVMAWAVFRVERLRPGQLVGIAVGIVGVIVIIAPGAVAEAASSTVAQLALLGATACYGFSLAYMRRFLAGTGLSGIAFAFGYIAPAALFMLLLSPFVLVVPMHLTVPVVLSIVTLGVLGTGVAYVWNQNTLSAWGPTRASTVTYITPVVGVVLGVLVLGERISWNEPVGAAVVFVGILLVQQRLRLRRRVRAGDE